MKIAPAMIIKKLFLAGKIYTLNSNLKEFSKKYDLVYFDNMC